MATKKAKKATKKTAKAVVRKTPVRAKTATAAQPKAAKKKAAKAASAKAPAKAAEKASAPPAALARRPPPPPRSRPGGRGRRPMEGEAPKPVRRPRPKGGPGPLKGLKVLDMTSGLPGPAATLMLANFGAEVIKIEPLDGERARTLEPNIDGVGAIFSFLNRGKKSVAVNLKTRRGKEAFLALAAAADVLVEDRRAGQMDSLGLGYKKLHAANKKLIYVSVTGYGQQGPRADAVGADLNYLALSGVLTLLSGEGGAPQLPGLQLAEIAAGAFPAVIGVLLALAARERSGEGQLVDVAVYDGLMGLLYNVIAEYSATRRQPQRGKEILYGGYACYNIYPARNGRWLAVGALEPKFWANLCKALERPDMVADQYSGGDRQQVMIAELTRVFQRKEVAEWLEFFEGQDVCVTPVLDLGDAVHDEHLRDRETIVADKHAEMGTLPQVGVFPKLSATPGDIGAEAPALGRHTAEALKSVGFNDKTVKELLRSKAVRQAD